MREERRTTLLYKKKKKKNIYIYIYIHVFLFFRNGLKLLWFVRQMDWRRRDKTDCCIDR